MADLLECVVMPYVWGSHTTIAELQGRPRPTPQPEAELWIGAHPGGPSRLIRDGHATNLLELVARDALRELGSDTVSAFGARLPFLLKVLAAQQPLSLQAHPNATQAHEGFVREERAGLSRDSPRRQYKDSHHKPELIVAVSPLDALCGFRRADQTRHLLDMLGVEGLGDVRAALTDTNDRRAISRAFRVVMSMAPSKRSETTKAVAAACESHTGPFLQECRWVARLQQFYPGDPAVVAALLLNLVHLEPGEALYLGAGILHSYLGGVGVEIMASSDNVLRAGLSPKHVDVEELTRILTFDAGPVSPITAEPVDAHEQVWRSPAAEFELSRILVRSPLERAVAGPELLLCYEGSVTVTQGGQGTTMRQGSAAFIPGASAHYALSGRGLVFRAAVPVARAIRLASRASSGAHPAAPA